VEACGIEDKPGRSRNAFAVDSGQQVGATYEKSGAGAVVRPGEPLSRREVLHYMVGGTGVAAGAWLSGSGTAFAKTDGYGAVAAAPPRRPAHRLRDVLVNAPADAVALTIDDGPDPRWTPQVLELLHRYEITATFSVVGMNAHAHPELIRRIVGEGHSLCNHSMTHPQPFTRLEPSALRAQITDAQNAIMAVGQAPQLFRSPGGRWSEEVFSVIDNLKLTPIDWDIDPRDWSRPGAAAIAERLLAAQGGDILLCHDGGGDRAQTVQALQTVLPTLKNRGLKFVRL
jgi:peptidoglycan-N-acetylglucosamine deacetylase